MLKDGQHSNACSADTAKGGWVTDLHTGLGRASTRTVDREEICFATAEAGRPQ